LAVVPLRLTALQEYDLPPAATVAGAGADIVRAEQEQSNWCWAACIAMLKRGAVSQGDVVQAALGATSNTPLAVVGDAPNVLTALASNGLRGVPTGGRLPPDELRAALDRSAVLAAFDGGGSSGHVVLVVGYDPTTSGDALMLLVNDPLPNPPHPSWNSHRDLRLGLHLARGGWTQTVQDIR